MNERVRVRVSPFTYLQLADDAYSPKGLTIYRPIIYGNTAVAISEEERKASKNHDHTFRWTVAVRSPTTPPNSRPETVGGADDLNYFIKRVTFKLHDTYPNPNRSSFSAS